MAQEMVGHELLIISDKPAREYVDGKYQDKPNERQKIRVVMWIKEPYTPQAKAVSVKLGCGKQKFNAATGEVRFYPAEWGLKDLEACAPHAAQYRAWMAAFPPVPEQYLRPRDGGAQFAPATPEAPASAGDAGALF